MASQTNKKEEAALSLDCTFSCDCANNEEESDMPPLLTGKQDDCFRGDESNPFNGSIPILEIASNEIETMRIAKAEKPYHSFPTACLSLLKNLEGNGRCVDCGEHNPQWAAVRYGALVCLHCSGHHRSLGVQVSTVRSVTMDEWSLEEVVSMLEGGNAQLLGFFSRHALTENAVIDSRKDSATKSSSASLITSENVRRLRYKTKAALFYRNQMEMHVANVLHAGPYRGREISRRLKHHPLDKRNSTVE
jgi:Putative GTPase activating protein for Arf